MTKSRKSKSSSSEFSCPFCDKVYKSEKPLAKHACAQKKRFFERDTPSARLAFHAYKKFFKTNYRTEPTYEKFMKSSLYDAFLNFGKYIRDINAISPHEYIDYMLKSNVPIDRWCKETEYIKYVRTLTVKESPHRALERTVILMQEWAIKNNTEWKNFFREVSAPLAVQWIMSGRLSPWVMLNCISGQEMLERFSEEQKNIIATSLNNKLWIGKFNRHLEEVVDIRQALADEGL